MIETERLMPNGVYVTFCEFTSDETYSMAEFVMDCLCLPWMDSYPEFHRTLSEIFYRCSGGKDMTQEQALRLAGKYERFIKYGLPQFPKIKGGSRLVVPKDIHGADAVEWLITEKARIWREVWESHKHIRGTGGFWKFPGGEPDELFLQQQRKREEKFWAEVDERQTEYGCSRQAAIRAVSDYMPRAESEYQLVDPSITSLDES